MAPALGEPAAAPRPALAVDDADQDGEDGVDRCGEKDWGDDDEEVLDYEVDDVVGGEACGASLALSVTTGWFVGEEDSEALNGKGSLYDSKVYERPARDVSGQAMKGRRGSEWRHT